MKNKGWNLENTYISLPQALYTRMELNPVRSPELIFLNSSLAEDLGLDAEQLKRQADVLGGNKLPEGSIPIAQAYSGHQFGYFTTLGDGRTILLGEQITPEGERFDIQLKGSGRTPYSRGGDGRSPLGPMLREYIISEAMHGLGIPTTRGLAVVTTGEKVRRETLLPGAILTRVAASHLRVGTFEYASNNRNEETLKQLADYTIERHFKHIEDDRNPYLSLLEETIKLQASLIAKWQLVGFIHGVMNTDNMTISGETIDYGPCAFMDTYDPETVFSSIDREARYAYKNQPNIAVWNLSRFAETLIPLIDEDKEKAIELCKEALSEFASLYAINWTQGMRKKLGLFDEKSQDKSIIESLLTIMYRYKSDYTNIFRSLTLNEYGEEKIFESEEFKEWNKIWKERLDSQERSFEESQDLMKKNNPSVIPRNHGVEKALKAAETNKDYSVMEELLEALKDPYDYSDKFEEYSKPPFNTTIPYKTYCGT